VQFIISQDIAATCSGFVVKYNNWFKVYLLLNSMQKNFENRSIFGYDMSKSVEVPFLTHSVYIFLLVCGSGGRRNVENTAVFSIGSLKFDFTKLNLGK
jgi:hypothetical protein